MQLLNKKQLAERLDVHPNTIDNYMKQGLLRPRRISSRCIRFIWEEVASDLNLGS